jgi:beta-glucosidase
VGIFSGADASKKAVFGPTGLPRYHQVGYGAHRNDALGAGSLSITQRYHRALAAGGNLFSGTADPTELLKTVQSNPSDQVLVDESVRRLLLEKFALGLFENPYVDKGATEKIVNNTRFQARAGAALRKSIVLLRNDTKRLPLKARTKVYFELYYL